MHRQSLGSPASKLHLHSVVKDEILASNPQEETQENKTQKLKPKISKSHEKYIHFIPILTLFCFFILYLSSHNPSANDLAQFNLSAHFPKPTDSEHGIGEIETNLKIKSGDTLAIRRLKNLEVEEKTANGNRKDRLHRKIGDF